MRRSRQMSESIELGIVLALAGGFMDAYSYMCRDGVFANAQTGNMLLLGINLSERNWGMALHYLFPVLAFAIGIALADVVRMHAKDKSLFHWRQLSVLCEALVLFVVCFFPQSMNLAANSLTSLACGTQNWCDFHYTKNKESAFKGMLYYGIILMFIIGAIIGNAFVKLLAEKAILICAAVLFMAFIMMFVDKEKALEQ